MLCLQDWQQQCCAASLLLLVQQQIIVHVGTKRVFDKCCEAVRASACCVDARAEVRGKRQ
jgi:hypothetical protein